MKMNRECFSVKIVLVLLMISLNLKVSSSQEVNYIGTCDESTNIGYVRCALHQNIEIKTKSSILEVVFNKDVNELDFSYNREIFYLPILLDGSFYNLLGYFANHCSLTTITKNNFVNLRSLTVLMLTDNEIQNIKPGTFQDLTSLQTLDLSSYFIYEGLTKKNQLKFKCRLLYRSKQTEKHQQ